MKPKHKSLDQNGFLPLLVTLLLIVAAVIYLAFTRVLHAKGGV